MQSSQAVTLRDASVEDAPAMLAILNHEIATGTATWRDAPLTLEDMRGWIAERQTPRCAVLLAEHARATLGFAAFGPFRTLGGYRLTVEHSVYVSPAAQSRGAGDQLMRALIARAQVAQIHVMLGLVAAENVGSIRFHQRFGFAEVGRLPEVGRKFGRWLDLVILQKTL